jgi:hypothetical protein
MAKERLNRYEGKLKICQVCNGVIKCAFDSTGELVWKHWEGAPDDHEIELLNLEFHK